MKEEWNVLPTIKQKRDGWTSGTLRRNCLLKQVIEEKIERRGRRGRICKQLMSDLKQKCMHCNLKEEALYFTYWRIRFGRDYEPV